VKSGPPAWAYFRFQGVPRDPILRPKSHVGILNVKKCIFTISHFDILIILSLFHFDDFGEIGVFIIDHFLMRINFDASNVIRPYCNYYIGGSMIIMCGGSPLFFLSAFIVLFW